jgi:hypothetical protein
MRKFFAAAVVSAVALVGFAGTASASATIDLFWTANGTDTIADLTSSSSVQLSVVLTSGDAGSQGAGVSVDYSGVSGLTTISFLSTPSGPLPIALGSTTDTGSRIQNVNSGALPPYVGTGLTAAGQTHQLGTVMFHAGDLLNGTLEITSDANGPTDGVLNLAGGDITATTTFNSAFIVNVPEPGAISLLVMGLGGMMLAGRGRRS